MINKLLNQKSGYMDWADDHFNDKQFIMECNDLTNQKESNLSAWRTVKDYQEELKRYLSEGYKPVR